MRAVKDLGFGGTAFSKRDLVGSFRCRVIVLLLAVSTGCLGASARPLADSHGFGSGAISCIHYRKDGQPLVLGIPNELIPGGAVNHGGWAFYLNVGVDLKDFSAASSVPGADPNLSKPDWSILAYGYNPHLDIVSGADEPPYRHLALGGKLPELLTDMPEFRRFDTCSGCGTDLYLSKRAPDRLSMRCYVPFGNRVTGCRVYEAVGDMSLAFSVPYDRKQNLGVFSSRISDLLTAFENVGRERCRND